jgi:hypothetical protein
MRALQIRLNVTTLMHRNRVGSCGLRGSLGVPRCKTLVKFELTDAKRRQRTADAYCRFSSRSSPRRVLCTVILKVLLSQHLLNFRPPPSRLITSRQIHPGRQPKLCSYPPPRERACYLKVNYTNASSTRMVFAGTVFNDGVTRSKVGVVEDEIGTVHSHLAAGCFQSSVITA